MFDIKKGTNCFYIGDSEKNPLAIITYVPTGPNLITVNHTYVSEQLSGQRVGKLLLNELIKWARKDNLKIIPQCSFVKAQMEKNSEYHDLLA